MEHMAQRSTDLIADALALGKARGDKPFRKQWPTPIHAKKNSAAGRDRRTATEKNMILVQKSKVGKSPIPLLQR
jgi:hypothetical protein